MQLDLFVNNTATITSYFVCTSIIIQTFSDAKIRWNKIIRLLHSLGTFISIEIIENLLLARLTYSHSRFNYREYFVTGIVEYQTP